MTENPEFGKTEKEPADLPDQECPAEEPKMQAGFVSMVRKICEEIGEIEKLTENVSYRGFVKDQELHASLMTHISRIQEISENVPPGLKARYPDVDWEVPDHVRDNVLHPVLGLNPESLWDLSRMDLPFCRKCLVSLIEEVPVSHDPDGNRP